MFCLCSVRAAALAPMSGRRAYGTGTLDVVGRSWIGSWYGPDGRRVRRKVGNIRTEGRADGLTKAQAERALRRMRELDRPSATPSERVTMGRAGTSSASRLELEGPAKSHALTVASDLRNHIAPFFAGRAWITVDKDIERYVAAKRQRFTVKTIHDRVDTMSRSSTSGCTRAGAGSIRASRPTAPTVKKPDAAPVPRPARARAAAHRAIPGGASRRSRPCI